MSLQCLVLLAITHTTTHTAHFHTCTRKLRKISSKTFRRKTYGYVACKGLFSTLSKIYGGDPLRK